MKNTMTILSIALATLLFAGCAAQNDTLENAVQNTAAPSATETSAVRAIAELPDTSDQFSDRDFETSYDESKAAFIALNGSSAACSSDAVTIAGSAVTVTDEGTYVLTGTLNDGTVTVNAENTDKVQLVLDGVTINSETSAAIYVLQADKVFITLAAGSQNNLTNGGAFEAVDENNIDAVIFSKDDLTLNGGGTLTVASPAGHGVVSKDDLVVTGGEYAITALEQGLSGKESVRIADGALTATVGKDGIHAENADDASSGYVCIADGSFNITAEGDGISASGVIQILGGSYTMQTGGGSATVRVDSQGDWGWNRRGSAQNTGTDKTLSAKGVKATGGLFVYGGDFVIDSADDALHSNAALTIDGGCFSISTGDDGIHADETATLTNGSVSVTKSYEGIEGQNIVISGGTIDIVSSDDGLNAAGGNDQSGSGGYGGFQRNGGFGEATDSLITISGGSLSINASGDGVDSNGSLLVTGGETYVSGPTNSGNGALDYGGDATISGGIFVAAGSSGMAQNFGASSTQGAMLVSISGSEGDVITLTGSSDETLIQWTSPKLFDCILISHPDIRQGAAYTVTVGTNVQEVIMDSLIYGNSTGMGGMPGEKGGGRGSKGPRPQN